MQTNGAPQDPFESFNKISHNDDDIDNGVLQVGAKHIPFLLSSCSTFDTAKILSKLLASNNWKIPRVVLFLDASIEEMLDTSEECRSLGHLLIKGLMSTLNTTETWLCTNGLDEGFTSELGEAFKKEISRRKVLFRQKSRYAFPEAALIGIHRLDALRISEKIEFMREDLEKQQGLKKDINENFDCYIFLKDAHRVKQGVLNFMLSFLSHISEGRISLNDDSQEDISRKKIPVLVILFHGELNDMDMILGLIKKGLPLIVIKGSGGLADLIVFIYSQIRNFHDSINLGEYCETVIKPLFLERWDKLCPNGSLNKTLKQEIFMKIINCVRCSYQHGRETITVLNRFDLEDDSVPLTSYLLKASFNSRPDDFISDSHNMRADLLLTMNWNNPDVAKSEILYKDNGFKIDNEIFFMCLVKPEREQFIAMFLKNGFKVRKFINSQVLSSLFQNSLKEMFFRSVVWETIFGYRSTVKIPGYAIEHKLSHLLEKFTSIPDLMNCHQIYCGVGDELKEDQSERRAISVLTLWAVLSYRSDLVKILLNYSEQSVYLAVVCSAVFNRLKTFVVDLNMQEDISQQSKMLSETAIQLLSYCYDKVPCRALVVLCAKSPVWSYKPLIETAAFAKNRYFLAHPCCQKYLDCVLMGNINIVNLRYGDVTLPQWLKIILCTFFVCPMFLWIKFESTNLSENSYHAKFHDSVKRSVNGNFLDAEKNVTIFKKLYYLYTAPISKFWMNIVFHFIYLFVFSVAVLWPACGNPYLDFAVCIWTLMMLMDLVHQYIFLQYPSMVLRRKVIDIISLTVFLACYMANRLILQLSFFSSYNTKAMLCLALLYFYYRFTFQYFPISSELGSLIWRIKRMILIDFMGFMRFAVLVMIGNGIALHALVYPDYPFNLELGGRIIYNLLTALFLIPHVPDDFGIPDSKCFQLKRQGLGFIGLPKDICKVGRYNKPECPNPGIWPYILGFQYFIILKLILITLLYVLFRYTARKLDSKGSNIWTWRRYEVIMDFKNRFVLPPPLNPLNYAVHIFACTFGTLFKRKTKVNKIRFHEADYKIWKSLAGEYFIEKSKKSKHEEMKRMKYTFMLRARLKEQKRIMNELQGYLTELQILVRNTHKHLVCSSLKVPLREKLNFKQVPQIFSRTSPYPGTNILRFPVSDKNVSWNSSWAFYDPIAYTIPVEDFPKEMRIHVDVDIQLKREKEGDHFQMPFFKFNTCTINPGGVCFDRQSWMLTKFKVPLIYELDSEQLPKNPIGRTGLRGRGSLCRWGPNHHIFAVITRWQDIEFVTLHKYLDVVLVIDGNGLALPGGCVFDENKYHVLSSSAFQNIDTKWIGEAEMINFFLEQEDTVCVESRDECDENSSLTFSCVKKGYFDEATNTDQAWCEAEVWHFHYNTRCTNVETKFKANTIWVLLTENILTKMPVGQAALLHDVAKKMKATLEAI